MWDQSTAMLRLVSFLLFATLAFAQQRVIINDLVEKQMDAHNKILTKYGLGMNNVAEGSANGVEFGKGIQLGGNTLKRVGDSYATKKQADTTFYEYAVGYDLLLFAFSKINVNGKIVSGYFRVKDNRMQFDFTIVNGTEGCKVHMDEYKFLNFGDVVYETSEPLTPSGGQLLVDLKEALLNHVNNKIEEKKPAVEKHLQAMCQPNSFPKGRPPMTGPSLAVTMKPPHA